MIGVRRRLNQALLLLPVFYVLSFTLSGGNLTEEFSLPPLLLCLYLTLFFLDERKEKSLFWKQHLYTAAGGCFGFCFGMLAFIRVTNAAFLCALSCAVVIILLQRRQFRELRNCIFSFLVCFAAALMPSILYYGSKGLLPQMIDSVFVLGIRYSGEKTIVEHLMQPFPHWTILLIAVPGVIFLFCERRAEQRLLAILCTAFTFFSVASGNNYLHYYTLVIPLLVLAETTVSALGEDRKQARRLAILLTVLMLAAQQNVLTNYSVNAYRHIFHQEYYPQKRLVRELSEKIPEEDKDSVFCYDVDPSWYTYADLFPCNRYCGWQSHYIRLMPQIAVELQDWFEAQPPRWLVLPEEGEVPVFLEEVIGQEYILRCHNIQYKLYEHLGRDC